MLFHLSQQGKICQSRISHILSDRRPPYCRRHLEFFDFATETSPFLLLFPFPLAFREQLCWWCCTQTSLEDLPHGKPEAVCSHPEHELWTTACSSWRAQMFDNSLTATIKYNFLSKQWHAGRDFRITGRLWQQKEQLWSSTKAKNCNRCSLPLHISPPCFGLLAWGTTVRTVHSFLKSTNRKSDVFVRMRTSYKFFKFRQKCHPTRVRGQQGAVFVRLDASASCIMHTCNRTEVSKLQVQQLSERFPGANLPPAELRREHSQRRKCSIRKDGQPTGNSWLICGIWQTKNCKRKKRSEPVCLVEKKKRYWKS